MLRPPVTLVPQIKEACPASVTMTTAVLFVAVPSVLAKTDGSWKLWAGRNPTGSVPAVHIVVDSCGKFQTISTTKPLLR